jgi:hypothetical protein
LKIKVFIWLLYREAILTKDNSLKEISMGMLSVVSVIVMRPYNICSLIVHLLSLYGGS